MINKYFIKKYLIDETGLDYITILSNINSDDIKKVVYKHYIEWYKQNLINSAKENPNKFSDNKFHEIYTPVVFENINIIFIKTTKDKDEDKEENKDQNYDIDINKEHDQNNIEIEIDDIEFEKEKTLNDLEDNYIDKYPDDNIVFMPKVNYKFRISSDYLPRNFEFFMIKYKEFFSTVAKFHLPIVRSYFNGKTVYMTPSCISACMTQINIDYKYFAGSKDPIEIINKYRMRGFGTILNEREILRLIEYSNIVPKWKSLYSLDIKSHESILKILGTCEINSTLFKPSKILQKKEQFKYELPNTYELLSKLSDKDIINKIEKYYNVSSNDNLDLNKILCTTFNKNGYVEPVKKWLIDAYNDNKYKYDN
jgi:hypothetical protein